MANDNVTLTTLLTGNMTPAGPGTLTSDATTLTASTETTTLTSPVTSKFNMTTETPEMGTSTIFNTTSPTANDTSVTTEMTTSKVDEATLAVLACVCALTVLLNIVLCAVIARKPNLHHMVFYYIASAAISDCLRVATVMSLSTVRIVTGSWQVSTAVCEGWYYLHIFFTTNSLCHIGFMSADVYFTIKDPVRSKLSNRTARNVFRILRTWITAAATTGIPFLVFHTTQIGSPIKFLGCGNETVEYILCSSGLGVLLPIVVVLIIDVGASVAIRKKRRLIQHLQSKERASKVPATANSFKPVGEHFVRVGSFYAVNGQRKRWQNSSIANGFPSQIIEIKITDPEENTTTVLKPSLKGRDNPSFVPDECDVIANGRPGSAGQRAVNQNSNQSEKLDRNHVELKVLNGKVHTGGDSQDEAHIVIHNEPLENNNTEIQPIENKETSSPATNITSTNCSTSEQPQASASTSHTTVNTTTAETLTSNVTQDTTTATDQTETPQSYMDQIHQEQYLQISARLANINAIMLLMILLFASFLLLVLPFYITYIVYVLCAVCQQGISQTLIWALQWLSFSTSIIHPIITLIIIKRVTK